jgi:uncharacterized protein
MKKIFRTFVSATAMMVASPIFATETPMVGSGSTAPDSRTSAPTVDADPAIWVLKDADTTIYLFGTVHILKPGLGWFDEAISEAFETSGELVTELPKLDEAKMGADMMTRGLDTTGTTLRSRMNPEQSKSYEAALASLSLPAQALDSFEPWMAALTLSIVPLMQQGYDVNSGVEKILEQKSEGRAAPMPRIGLETVEEQLGYFDSLPMEGQMAYLMSVVDNLPKMATSIDNMVDNWAKGDADGLGKTLQADMAGNEALMKILLTDRNARWAKWIEDRMSKPGVVFIAVGAGHLAGKDSVQEFLGKKGLKSERIAY